MIQQSGAVLAAMNRLDEQLNQAPLPRLIIHGDYGLHNLLFQSTTQATPVDFELARLEWRLSDLVSCLSKLRYASGEYDFDSMTHFMDGYRREYPISDEEWMFFPQVWQFYRLMGAVQYWKSYFETSGPIRKLHSALDSIAQSKWALDNPEKILAINTDWRGVGHA
jgi:Ser/Thr protein kinase RdoA (MazF antagonist)